MYFIAQFQQDKSSQFHPARCAKFPYFSKTPAVNHGRPVSPIFIGRGEKVGKSINDPFLR